LTVGLLDDLFAGAVVVREGVVGVAVLVEDVLLGRIFCSCFATPMWLSGASQAASVGVRMISAPRASSTTCFSRLIFSGIVMMTR
jgi:hypothetical protein